MNRRSLFRSRIFAPTAALAVKATPVVRAERVHFMPHERDVNWKSLVNHALTRLGCLAPGEHASNSDYEFCSKFVRRGMTDVELAIVLQPYYVSAKDEEFAWTPPTVCLKCGAHVWHIDRYLTKRGTEVIQCSDVACENNWPWIQRGNVVQRVSPRAKFLIKELESPSSGVKIALYTDELYALPEFQR